MRPGLVLAVVGAAIGCAPTHPTHAPRSDARCTVRISERGTFVDGERTTQADAIARCKRAPGGAVLVVEDDQLRAESDATRVALERERVRVYVLQPLCHEPQPLGCRPRAAPRPMSESDRRRVVGH